jgi:hypothetical protein
MFGCGYEEPVENPRPGPFCPPGYLAVAPRDAKGKVIKPKVCIGYTRSLPVVQETQWDVLYAEDWGTFAMKYGEWTEEHEQRMRTLKLARGHVDKWRYENPVKKPGQP